jgi:hypothetical protein
MIGKMCAPFPARRRKVDAVVRAAAMVALAREPRCAKRMSRSGGPAKVANAASLGERPAFKKS